jgi:heterodisulfide reductase subunit B
MKRTIGYYPGCSLEGSSREYKESVSALAQAFDIVLEQVPDWNCCGASAAHNLNKKLSLALPARVLAKASAAGMTEMLVPCAACYNKLSVVQHELQNDAALLAEVEEVMGEKLGNPIRILNIIQFVQEEIVPRLGNRVVQPFDKVACYYGCLLVRPNDILKFDRVEDPQLMDEVMQALGAETIDWPFKTECCGAGLSVSRTDVVANLSGKIVKEASERGAKAIIVACPMCHSNLDMRRAEINKRYGMKYNIPVIYLSQAIGIALGLQEQQTGLHRHFVKVDHTEFCKMQQRQPVTEQ